MTAKYFIFISTAMFMSCAPTHDTDDVEAPIAAPIVEPVSQAKILEMDSFKCPHQEQREIYFSSKEFKDTLDIQIIGDDCDQANINLRIITPDGDVIYNSTARALSYTNDGAGASGVQWVLQDLVKTESQLNSFPENLADLSESNGYYDVNLEAVKAARSKNLPFFCHKAGKSFSNCFIFWKKKTILAYSSGS